MAVLSKPMERTFLSSVAVSSESTFRMTVSTGCSVIRPVPSKDTLVCVVKCASHLFPTSSGFPVTFPGSDSVSWLMSALHPCPCIQCCLILQQPLAHMEVSLLSHRQAWGFTRRTKVQLGCSRLEELCQTHQSWPTWDNTHSFKDS